LVHPTNPHARCGHNEGWKYWYWDKV